MKRALLVLAALLAAGTVAAEEPSVKQKIKAGSRELHKKARAARQEAGREARKLRDEGRKTRLELKRKIKGDKKS